MRKLGKGSGKRLAALLAVLLLAGCAGTPDVPPQSIVPPAGSSSSSAISPIPPAGPPAPSQPEEPASSYVRQLAKDIATQTLKPGAAGEPAIRALYHKLIETVYFADPVGLDIWRYRGRETEAIPYLENRALSPLLFGIGSCEDFAAAMVILLEEAGFEAQYVAGYTLSVEQVYIDHAWAVVKLEDSWYHIDPQLEQNVTRGNLLTYRYYLKSDDAFQADHKWGQNLIDYWPWMPELEQERIRREYTPPGCNVLWPSPEPVTLPLPRPPDRGKVEADIHRMKLESGKGILPPLFLNVEPPVLVAEGHVTPILLPGQPVPSNFRYGRTLLEGEDAALYDKLSVAAAYPKDAAPIPLPDGKGPKEIQWVIDTFLGDYPEYYWAAFPLPGEGEKRELTLTPLLAWEELPARQTEIDKRVGEVLDSLYGLSDFERALAIHDMLAALPYDREETAPDSGNLYGALVGGTVFCNGYAAGFQHLARLAGLDCAYIKGHSLRGQTHAWNALLLDGAWHYVDATWDRPLGEYDDIYHDYFLMSQEEMLRDRRWNSGQYDRLPQGTAEPEDYYRRMDYAVYGDTLRPAEAMADIFYRQLAAKGPHPQEEQPVFLELKVIGDSRVYAQWKESYIKQVFEILRLMDERARQEGAAFQVSRDTAITCDFNDKMQVLTFYPKIKGTEG